MSTEDLARSVVQIVALDSDRTPVWTGSGTVVSSDGLILTNAHVVDDRFDEYARLGVAVIERTDEPPEPSFIAEIVAVDYALDLAVIRIVSDLDGDPVEPDLPTIVIGNSEFPLAEGLYELVLSVEGEVQTADSVFVGGDHPRVEIDVVNEGDIPACFVFISPSRAENWGQDELGPTDLIDLGESRTFPIPADLYDILVEDCDGNTLAEDYDLDMAGGGTYTVG